MPPRRYPVPAAPHRVSQTIERSRFIATVERVSSPAEAGAFVERVRAEFPDATHHCSAFAAGAPGDTGQVGMSDDGEPHGTAGRPILTVLLHSGVGEIAAVVTRYYGGVKLGTGGLARAYGGTVALALETLPRAERVTFVRLAVEVDYAAVSLVQQLLPAHEAVAEAQDYGEAVRYVIRVPEERAAAFRAALLDGTRGRGRAEPLPE
jgi:uncharacterized YigZ family protein